MTVRYNINNTSFKRRLISAIAKHHGLIKYICEELAIDRTAFMRLRKESPWINDLMDEAREEIMDVCEFNIMNEVKNKEPWALCWFSKTIGKKRGYTVRQEVAYDNNQYAKQKIKIGDKEIDF